MPTNFDTDFNDNDGDIIRANHVAQYAEPINDLEVAMDDKEDKSQKGAPNGYASLVNGKVPAEQLPSMGGGGASDLDDLTDVAISSPASGQVLKYNGTQFANAAMGVSDVSGLQSALDAKQDELAGVADVPGLQPALDAKQDELASTADVPGLDVALSGKSDVGHIHTIANVTGLQSALDTKLAVNMGGEPNGYAELDANGLVPAEQLPSMGGGGASDLDDLTDVAISSPASGQVLKYNGTQFANAAMGVSDVSGLQGALDAKQDELAGVADVPGLQTALDTKQDELTGTADVPGLDAALSGKSDVGHTHTIANVTGLQSALDAKLAVGQGGVAGGYAQLDSNGLVPSEQLPEIVGTQGPAGPDGPAGPKGDTGNTGPQGPAGQTGATGPQGPQGNTGPAGPQGNTGAQGPRGFQGIQGPEGPQGPAGPSSVSGSGATGRMAYWTSNSSVGAAYGEVTCGNIVATSIPGRPSSGAVVYAYTQSTLPSGQVIGRHHHLSSSGKYKQNIRPMEQVKALIQQLKPVRYEALVAAEVDENGQLLPDGERQFAVEESFGLIAEEVQEVFPDLVFSFADANESTLGVHYDRLPTYLLAALKEQQLEIDDLRARLAALEQAFE